MSSAGVDVSAATCHTLYMTESTDHTTTTYRVTGIERPSRSKCPNAWVRIDGADEWLREGDEVPAGTVLAAGGNIRRATRTERWHDTFTVTGDKIRCWTGFGAITFEEA